MKKFKASDEEAAFLQGLMYSDFYSTLPSLLEHLTEELVADFVRSSASQTSDRDLLIKKAKIEGAKELIQKLSNYRKSLK